jgi:hypothetical protein
MKRALPLLVLLLGCPAVDRPVGATPGDSDERPGDAPGDFEEAPQPPISCVSGVPCERECVDTAQDVRNCGGCGRTCVAINAEPACVSGACTLGRCAQGFADCDHAVLNGCERLIDCAEGASCATACGAQGTLSCADPCAPVCVALPERCNGVDDDCNAACDEGGIAGCRVGVHRASGGNGHLFTTNLAAANSWGTLEAANYVHLSADATADLRPFFTCPKANGNAFLSFSNDCDGTGAPSGTLGFIAPAPVAGASPTCGAVPLYHLHLDAQNWDFYTLSTAEVASATAAGWVQRGIVGYVWTAR